MSILAHLVIATGIGVLFFHSPKPAREEKLSEASALETDPNVANVDVVEPAEAESAVAPSPRGGSRIARIDTGDRGRGGELKGPEATNLADRNEKIDLTTVEANSLRASQESRLRTAEARASYRDRRASKEPMELTFLASGKDGHEERRLPSMIEPVHGVLVSMRSSILGATAQGGAIIFGLDPGAREGGEVIGSSVAAPAVGAREGFGRVSANSMPLTKARPFVAEGNVSVAAYERARPNDTVDSEQEVRERVRSLVQASSAGGDGDEGRGGTAGGGAAGAGGTHGAGSPSTPLGEGGDDWLDLDSRDARFIGYFRSIRRKLDPLWADAMPKEARLEMRQGTAIISFTIAKDGTVHVDRPIARASGIPAFDENCAKAIERASPFGPVPAALGNRVRIRAKFDARNGLID